MSRDLKSIIEEIAQNEEISKEFMAMDEIDEIYAYCKELGLSSSEEEFYDEISRLIYDFDVYNNQLDKRSLENVAGGINLNKNFNKVMGLALSTLAITGVGAVNNGFAVESASNPAIFKTNSVVSRGNDVYKTTKADKISNSLGDKAANVMAEIKRFIARHKLDSGILLWVP